LAWSAADAERWLDELQPVGWKLGLERMHRLMSLLGMPQNRYASIHVVGTNGKSSVTRMAAALAQGHGMPTGATFSPHLERWAERIWIRGAEVEPARFARAVERTAEAVAVVNRTLDEGQAVTQFEAAIGSTYVAMAGARVRLAVVEAGLGGRLDATNVIPSRVTVLTSIALDHTEWLGTDEVTIAREKLAVLRHGSVLVLGQVSPAVEAEAEAHADAMGATVLRGPEEISGIEVRARGAHQRRNFALAATAVAAALGRPLERDILARVGLHRCRPQCGGDAGPRRGAAGAGRGPPRRGVRRGDGGQGRRGDDLCPRAGGRRRGRHGASARPGCDDASRGLGPSGRGACCALCRAGGAGGGGAGFA
jgi:dihydrofolate synthase/folylpolyglutamate synthase